MMAGRTSGWVSEALRNIGRIHITAQRLQPLRLQLGPKGTLKLIPPETRLAPLAADYRAMEDMFFQKPPTWPEIITVLTALEVRLNQPT
jgi:hypothetical protein